ncbi:chromosome transmission fidelity protein 8 [Cryptococcus neoformans Tu401-1]|nr:chromosome transmission fidelity protein 8 [Cryptococcus neoformans var. grubii Tu401-1]OXM77814.1 chromosome transmission fidelity protein 8 [Cryptococcus neoformans var. grubii Bt63]
MATRSPCTYSISPCTPLYRLLRPSTLVFKMRIHLPLDPIHFNVTPTSASSPPLVQLGGNLVLVELQGELAWEGEKSNGVIGVIGLDTPDKPTLHLGPHHLLHGKFANLQKPYVVIRRVTGVASANGEKTEDPEIAKGIAVQGDAVDEESSDEEEEEDEEEGPLFGKDEDAETTPTKNRQAPRSSSPFYPPSTSKDYSSDIEMSSPVRSQVDDFGFPKRDREQGQDEDEEDISVERRKRRKLEEAKAKEKREGRKKRKEGRKERIRRYAVVGIVRKKVVFALRPEPLVAPTILPE